VTSNSYLSIPSWLHCPLQSANCDRGAQLFLVVVFYSRQEAVVDIKIAVSALDDLD
jgi:hypothetical protein